VLKARFHDGRSQTVHIREERMAIGSARGGIVLDDCGVCPEHAELLFREGIVGVRDKGSKRGTWVCGKRVDRAILKPGRWFRVGHTTFELVVVHPPVRREEVETQLWSVQGGFAGDSGVPAPAKMLDATIVRDVPRSQALAPRAAMAAARVVSADAPPVLIVEADPASRGWLEQTLAPMFRCVVVATAKEALDHVAAHPRTVVIVGRRLVDGAPDSLVAALGKSPLCDRVAVIVADGVAENAAHVYYRVRPGLAIEHLRRVVGSALRVRNAAPEPVSSTRAWSNKMVFDICAAASARPEPNAAAAAIEDGISRLLGCARASCVFFDAECGALWTEPGDGTEAPIEGNATTGIVGFVARTACAIHAPIAAADPRYDRKLDDPRGNGHEAILAVAAATRGEVHAVLVAVREPTQGAFDQKACNTLAQLGTELGPILHRMGNAITAEGALERLHHPKAMQLFRAEAVEARLQPQQDHGEPIRIAPHWSRAMYWMLVALVIVGVFGVAIGEISQYSTGPAVVRQEGRAEVTAVGAGSLVSIDVEPGQRVVKGQVLARLRDVSERAEYDSTRSDFHAQLRNRLLDPTDEAAAQQVRTLQRQLESAEAALEQRVVRAPNDGIVTDIGVETGQHVDTGDAVMSVVDDRALGLELIAFLPGGDRPQIESGMSLRLELLGFDYAYQDVVVETISEGVVGPNEAKRMLGPQLADTLPIGGGVVMVRARLPTRTFVSDGTEYPYHDGMGGVAEVRMRDETILEMLVPALKEL
jgi:membrane fusion protein (multidrug efflux system)